MTEHAERSEKTSGRENRTGVFLQLDSGQTVTGILEVMPDGFGFIRSDNYLPGDHDIYVSPSQIRRFNLKTGDIISGNTRIRTNTTQQEKFAALLYLKSTNGMHPAEAAKRISERRIFAGARVSGCDRAAAGDEAGAWEASEAA